MTIESNIFRGMEKLVDGATSTFVSDKSADIITAITPWAIAGVALYLSMYGYLVIAGRVQEPLKDFFLKAAKIILISSLCLKADTYAQYVVSGISGIQTGLGDALSGTSGGGGIFATLDRSLSKGFELMNDAILNATTASWYDFGTIIYWYSIALLIIVASTIITIIGGIIVLVAVVSIKIMFAVGPVFIMCVLFPFTARFFDSWFNITISYVLKMVIVAVIMTFANEIFSRIITPVSFDGSSDGNGLVMAIEIIIAALLLYKLIRESEGMAAGLGGGISSSVLSWGQALNAAKAPFRAVKNAVNPVSTRRDMQSGMMTTAGRLNHLIAGNTVVNPAYRQHVMQNMGKNWGRASGGNIKPK